MQRSRGEGEAGEKRRKQDEDKAKVTQRCTHVDEEQRGSDEEEPEEKQSRIDQDKAEHKQPRADKDKECPGLDHPRQNKKEWPKRNDHERRRKETRHPPAWSIRGGTSSRGRHPPTLEHLRRSGGQTPRTGSSGVGQAAGTAAPRTGASRDERRWTPPGLEHPGQNKHQARRGASGVATTTKPWRYSRAEWRKRSGRSGEDKMRTRPR